ncbi:MAG TPA: hypothetical protein VFP88_01110 [Rhodanobacteraceae bacterium]|nr:hypothetical protein [Rhodanobacteraceae bacterium]
MTVALLAFAGAAFAQARNGAWLMGLMRSQALQHAAHARAAHHDKDAANWQGWAGLYAKIGADPRIQKMDAATLARNSVRYNQQEALVMTRNGIGPGADLYNASTQMWADLALQIESGAGTPQVHFPEKQMLSPIEGLAGTPWVDIGGRHASDCRVLAQRAQSCRAQLSQLQHHNIVTGQDNGMFEVMRLRQCDAAQELYVAQCESD